MEYALLPPEHITSLTRIWQKATFAEAVSETWETDLRHIYELGLGMQELLEFLYGQRPGLSAFLQWAAAHSTSPVEAQYESAEVLSTTDLEHWQEHGYVVVRNAVSKQECTAANEAIWAFLGADPADADSWYRPHPAKSGMMVVFTQDAALQAIRDSPRIRKAYEQLYGTTAIYKLIDKVSFNPPQNDQYRFAGSPLHWDTSLVLPIPERFQGLLYLSDVTAAGGAFQCVPGFHRNIAEWMEKLPAGVEPRQYALNTLQPVSVPGNAGDFIIWHQALPHCASPNNGSQPRLVQYLTYLPDHFVDNRSWK